MLAFTIVVLAGGAKGFFEDPSYLIGIPLVALGVIGLLIALSRIGGGRPPRGNSSAAPGTERGSQRTETPG